MKFHCLSKTLLIFPQTHRIPITLASLSTKTLKLNPPASSLSSSSSSSSSSPSLYQRIETIRDPTVSVIPVLEQWVNEGQIVPKKELRSLVRIMKDFKRFNHALEISQWMTDRRYFNLSPGDAANRLELIHRVHGLEHAENYFNNISNKLKKVSVYGALLSGYTREKSVDKAEGIMQKMRDMDMADSSFPYNMLINLYTQTGEHGKIDMLVQEMEAKGIPQDQYTMQNRMAACVAASDISGMERILNRIEEDVQLVLNWRVYSLAASGYLKAGMTEKALAMLKKMEGKMPLQRKKLAFEFLLTLYTSTGHKEELYRVWNTHKPSNEKMDGLYVSMISSLAKLDDLEGAEKIFKEWESQCTKYDFRVLNQLVAAYCRKRLLNKAESIVKQKSVEGRTPYASTWHMLAKGYVEDKNMPKAIEMLKKALLIGRQGWRPHSITLAACLNYLKEQGDVEGMKEFLGLLKNLAPVNGDIISKISEEGS